MTWIRNSGGHPLIGASVDSESNMQTIVNLSGIEYWTAFFPFLNKMRNTDADWAIQFGATLARNDSRVDSNYELDAVPAGETIVRIWILVDDFGPTGLDYLKAGTYKITWDGACVVDAIQDVSSVSTVGNVTTFSVASNANLIYIRVRNLTGSTASATNIKLYHQDHQSQIDAGELLDPDFVTWLQTWDKCRAFRFLDWQLGNFGQVTNAADLTPLSYISWCGDHRTNVNTYNGCPPEIIAEVAKKTGKDIWTVMWRFATDACMSAFFQRIYDHWPAGTYKVCCEGINEMPWNSGFPGYQYLADVYYTGITLRDVNDNIVVSDGSNFLNERLNSSYAHTLMRTWAAADAVFGSSRVRPIGCTQTSSGTQATQWVKWFQTGFQGGQRARDVLNSSSNRGRVVFTHYYSALRSEPSNVSFKTGCINDYGARTDDQWIDDWKANIDWITTNAWAARISTIQGLGVTCPFWCYEGGSHDFIDAHATGTDLWANFSGTVDTGANTLNMGGSGTSWFTNGDRVKSTGALATGVDGNNAGWVRLAPSGQVRFYTSQAAYDGDSGNTGAGAVTLNAGTYFVFNMTRHDRIATKLFNLSQGSRGLEITQYIITKLASVGIKTYTLFAVPGLMRLGMQRFTYSFDAFGRGTYETPDSPAVEYLKTLDQP